MGAFIAGTYYGTWGGIPLGITEQGYELDQQTYAELIKGDNFGDGVQDLVYRAADYSLRAVFEEWAFSSSPLAGGATPAGGVTTGPRATANENYPSFFPWNTLGNFGNSGVVGRIGSYFAQSIVLTPALGVPAAVLGNLFAEAVTFALCVLQEGQTTTFTFSTRHRKVGLRFRVLPYLPSAGNPYGTWFDKSNDVAG